MDASEQENQVDRDLEASFDRLTTGQFPVAAEEKESPFPSGSAATQDLEANLTELRARMDLTEQKYTVAVKERDATEEARQKLEKTLAEFLSRFAAVRETQAAAFREVNKLGDVRRELENKVAALSGQLAAAAAAKEAAEKERDTAMAQQTRAQEDLAAARAELNQFREAAVASLEPLGEEHSRSMKDLIARTDALMAEAREVREEGNQRLEKLEQVLAEFKGHVNTTRRDISARLSAVLGTTVAESGEGGTQPDAASPGEQPAALAGHVV
ncbi:MAG: hypothetical protein NTW87_25580 [Planctomycetota bacterium]|nr:hypothetical protein [Planctomycetota bacterium]